jgi:hypothetical protein
MVTGTLRAVTHPNIKDKLDPVTGKSTKRSDADRTRNLAGGGFNIPLASLFGSEGDRVTGRTFGMSLKLEVFCTFQEGGLSRGSRSSPRGLMSTTAIISVLAHTG